MIIIGLIVGYFVGMASYLLQVIRMENRENKKIEEILKKRGEQSWQKVKQTIG